MKEQTFYNLYPPTETANYNPRDSTPTRHVHVLGVDKKMMGELQNQHQHHRGKRQTVNRFYNFTIIPPGNETKPVHLYGVFPMNASDDFNSLFIYDIGENAVVKFLPAMYHIQVITIDGSEKPFTLIEGKRCKWLCNRDTKECGEGVCWEKPSFCRGDHDDCLRLDGDGVCYDLEDIGYPIRPNHVWSSNSTHKVFTNIDVGRYVKFHGEDSLFISDDGQAQDQLKIGYHWACKEVTPGSFHIVCEHDWAHVGVSTRFLKTIAG